MIHSSLLSTVANRLCDRLSTLRPMLRLGGLILSLFLLLAADATAQNRIAIIEDQNVFRVIDRFGNPTTDGTYDFSVVDIARPVDIGYVNVFADLNLNGQIEEYDVLTGGTQNEWILQNVPLPMTGEILSEPSISLWFALNDLNVDLVVPLNHGVLITDQPIPVVLPLPFAELPPETEVQQTTLEVFTWGENDLDGQDLVELTLPPPFSFPFPDQSFVFEIPGPNDENGMPDTAQKTNECGPTSAANSLIWLAKENGFEDKLPQDADGNIDVDALILDLMEAMAGTRTRPFGGLTGNQLFDGKKKYIADKMLPLTVEGGNTDANASGANAFQFMVDQLDKGQDVELLVGWPGGRSSHWVTVTGYGFTPGQRAFIYVHDPDDNKTAKVVWELEVNDQGEITGAITSPNAATMLWAVAESPAEPMTPRDDTGIAEILDQDIFRVFDRFGNPTTDGTFDFRVDEILDPKDVGFVNVLVDLNGDGSIAPYQRQDGGTQEEWILRNVPLPGNEEILSEPSISLWFDLGDMSLGPGAFLRHAVLMGEETLDITQPQPLDLLGGDWAVLSTPLLNFDWGLNDLDGQDFVDLTLPPPVFFPDPQQSFVFEIPGPNDEDGMPDTAQKTNECGPTSAANSLIWLAKENGLEDKLPQDADGNIDVDALILDLMEAMAGTRARPFGGLTGNQLFDGKKKYIADKMLPLTVEGGNTDANASGANAFQFMVDQLNKGQDVELLVWWPGGGGHWVTVTGYGYTPGEKAFIYVHDPDDGKTAKVVWELEVNADGEITGDITSPDAAEMAWAVAESPTEDTDVEERSEVPQVFALYPNYPNPFNPTTTITFTLPRHEHVTLTIFDMLGRKVATLVDADMDPGAYSVVFEARGLGSGAYLYHMEAGAFSDTKVLTLVK